MKVKDYSAAVLELITNGMSVDDALTGLTTMLKNRGHMRLRTQILRDLTQRMEVKGTSSEIVVTLAKPGDETALNTAIKSACEKLMGSTYTIHIDETITGGFIAKTQYTQIDQSYKKKLLLLYGSLTK